MSNFMDLCLSRQSCRSFSDKPVEHEKLVKCVEAARLAPSGCNGQPWSFVVVENSEIVKEVAKCGQPMDRNQFLSDAAAFFVVLEEYANLMPHVKKLVSSQYFAPGDLGAATVYLCLEAEEQGLGTCIIGFFDRETIASLVDIPKEKKIHMLVAVGYPKDTKVRNKIRKPLEEIVKFV
jgi:nitroreductase